MKGKFSKIILLTCILVGLLEADIPNTILFLPIYGFGIFFLLIYVVKVLILKDYNFKKEIEMYSETLFIGDDEYMIDDQAFEVMSYHYMRDGEHMKKVKPHLIGQDIEGLELYIKL